MELLGANLNQLLQKMSGKFSLKTVLQLADQMIARIKFLHENDYLHRDIKPENFLMGQRDKTDKVGTICCDIWLRQDRFHSTNIATPAGKPALPVIEFIANTLYSLYKLVSAEA